MVEKTETSQLAELTLSLVDIPSESREERALAGHVGHLMEPLGLVERQRCDDYLLYTTERDTARPLVILAGHLDTVPAQGNLPGKLAGDAVIGLGAADMKGGLGVMIQLAYWVARLRPSRRVDLAFLFFTREELPVSESPLPELFEREPSLLDAELAVVLEPTANTIQAGCLGNLIATLRFHGDSAHSARPWTGTNAITVASREINRLAGLEPEEVILEGLSFYEVLSVTQISGGVADNIVPDLVECRVNYRFAPNRSTESAVSRIRELVGENADLEIASVSAGAGVAAADPLVLDLSAVGGFAIEPKQAWTPVAQFTEVGIPSINFGPGEPEYAHRKDEQVSIGALWETLSALKSFITAEQS